nr:hypothetical protein BaRGS_022539 [Batillaria attramentaria]
MTAECKEASQKLKEKKDLTTKEQHRLQIKFEQERAAGERRVKALEEEYAQKRRLERETASSFVLRVKLESLKLLVEVLENISSENLRQVVIQLFLDYHVRLRGIDTGLTFLLDSLSRKEEVLRHDQEIREALSKLFPERHRQRTKWSDLKPCGPFIDYSQLKLGQRMPDQGVNNGVHSSVNRVVKHAAACADHEHCVIWA